MCEEYHDIFYTVTSLADIGKNYGGYTSDVDSIKESVASFIKESVSSTEWNTVLVQVQIEEVYHYEDGWEITSNCVCLEEKMLNGFTPEEYGFIKLDDFSLT